MIHDNYIDIPLSGHTPNDNKSYGDWLANQIRYSTLCSDIVITWYGPEAESFGDKRNQLYQRLAMWKENLPHEYRDIDELRSSNLGCHDKKLLLFCQYHEAVLAIHNAWEEFGVSPPRSPLSVRKQNIPGEERTADRETCLHSARIVLDASARLGQLAVVSNRQVSDVDDGENKITDTEGERRKFHDLVSVATCLVFSEIARSPAANQDLPYLGMACGFFGMIATQNQVPFLEAMELLRVAQLILIRRRGS